MVDQPASADELPVVTGKVNQVFVDMFMGLLAEIKVDVEVEKSGKSLFSTDCAGKDRASAWTGSEGAFQDRLTAAMKQFVDRCVPKLAPYLEGKE